MKFWKILIVIMLFAMIVFGYFMVREDMRFRHDIKALTVKCNKSIFEKWGDSMRGD